MSKHNIAKDIVEAVLETPSFIKTVQIDGELVNHGWWSRLLIRIGIRKAPPIPKVNHDLHITPAKVTTIYALSGLLCEINEAVNKKLSEHAAALKVHSLLVRTIATGIHNKDGEAPEWLMRVISDQFTAAELNATAAEVYRRLDYENFFGTIISLGAANMIDTQETTAHGQPSEGLSHTTVQDGGQP